MSVTHAISLPLAKLDGADGNARSRGRQMLANSRWSSTMSCWVTAIKFLLAHTSAPFRPAAIPPPGQTRTLRGRNSLERETGVEPTTSTLAKCIDGPATTGANRRRPSSVVQFTGNGRRRLSPDVVSSANELSVNSAPPFRWNERNPVHRAMRGICWKWQRSCPITRSSPPGEDRKVISKPSDSGFHEDAVPLSP